MACEQGHGSSRNAILNIWATVEIRPYTQDLEPSVKALNQRLRAGGEQHWHFPESHVPRWPKLQNRNPYQELFVVVDRGDIRGGYLLTHSRFAIWGEAVTIACGPQMNLSEGIVNRRYSIIGSVQVRDALQRQPLMYALGMGGMDERLPMILAAMDWKLLMVPFYFHILSPSKFFANITYLRRCRRNRIVLEFLRYSRLGAVGVRLAQVRLWNSADSAYSESFTEFCTWADAIWEKCKGRYSFIAERDSRTLNALYTRSDRKFLRLRISRGGENLGWVVMLDTQMSGHKYFGNMRVGSIVDCLAAPEYAHCAACCATRFLERRGVDIVVSNQASSAWCTALAAAGFLKGPSNFILALSPKLADKLQPLDVSKSSFHMNRGDGDGPGTL
jgi:hypothetical protein